MKRTLKIFLIAAAAAIALSASALAAGYGLGVFGNVRTMEPGARGSDLDKRAAVAVASGL